MGEKSSNPGEGKLASCGVCRKEYNCNMCVYACVCIVSVCVHAHVPVHNIVSKLNSRVVVSNMQRL